MCFLSVCQELSRLLQCGLLALQGLQGLSRMRSAKANLENTMLQHKLRRLLDLGTFVSSQQVFYTFGHQEKYFGRRSIQLCELNVRNLAFFLLCSAVTCHGVAISQQHLKESHFVYLFNLVSRTLHGAKHLKESECQKGPRVWRSPPGPTGNARSRSWGRPHAFRASCLGRHCTRH